MNQNSARLPIMVFFVLFAAMTCSAQAASFSDANVNYVFDLPDARWKMTVKPSATSPNVEYVYIERNEGHFDVRKMPLARNAILSDVIRGEEQKQQFRPGYVAGKEENFGGFLKGAVFNFEYVRGGRAMTGRYYFLNAGDGSVYLLRFTGFRDKLKSIRNQTDSIARTFKLKKNL